LYLSSLPLSQRRPLQNGGDFERSVGGERRAEARRYSPHWGPESARCPLFRTDSPLQGEKACGAAQVERRGEAEGVGDAERDPKDPANARALQAALTKALKADPDAAKALEDLLKKSGASLSSQSANVVGDNNKVGQASGGSSVTIG
jgi:hypothetical protein